MVFGDIEDLEEADNMRRLLNEYNGDIMAFYKHLENFNGESDLSIVLLKEMCELYKKLEEINDDKKLEEIINEYIGEDNFKFLNVRSSKEYKDNPDIEVKRGILKNKIENRMNREISKLGKKTPTNIPEGDIVKNNLISVDKKLQDGVQTLSENAQLVYEETWQQYQKLQSEIKNPNSNLSQDDIHEELQYLGWRFALACEYALKSELLPNLTKRAKDVFTGNTEGKFYSILSNEKGADLYFKILVGEEEEKDLKEIEDILESYVRDKKGGNYQLTNSDKIDIKNFIDNNLTGISIKKVYGHQIDKMLKDSEKTQSITELKNWINSNPNFMTDLENKNVSKAFIKGRYDTGLPNTVFLAKLSNILIGDRISDTGLDSYWDNICQTEGFIDEIDRTEFRKHGDKLYDKISQKDRTEMNENEKRLLGCQCCLACEYYLKSLLPKNNLKNDTDKEELKVLNRSMTEEDKKKFIKASNNGDVSTQNQIIDAYLSNCTLDNTKIKNTIVESSHNLEILINGLDSQTRETILKNLNIDGEKIKIDANGMIELDSEIADAFEKGRYGLTGYKPDDGLYSLLENIRNTVMEKVNQQKEANSDTEGTEQVEQQETRIQEQPQPENANSNNTVSKKDIARADNEKSLTTSEVNEGGRAIKDTLEKNNDKGEPGDQ